MGLFRSKKDNVGAVVREPLAFMKASSWCGVQKKLFLVLSNGCRGVSNNAIELLHVESWFAKPKKERRSEQLAGVGKLLMASVMDESTWYPSADRRNPAK